MLLNRHRLLLSFAIFLMAIFGASCVDIPSEGITPPNYQSSVKYFNYGRGVDTISHLISSVSYTAKDSVTVLKINGSDTIRVKTRWIYSVLINRYTRFNVDFGQPLEMYVDGSLLATLAPGQATNYFSTPSGGRKIELKGNGTRVDSLRYTKVDTATTFTYDTIRNGAVKATKIVEKTGSSATVFFPAVNDFIGTQKITVDSSLVFIETERQMSLSFVGDTIASQLGLGGILRYGRIQYIVAAERKTFEPAGKVDSALIIIHNFSPSSTLRAFKSTLLRDSIRNGAVTNLIFKANTGNKPYPAKTDSIYKFVFRTTLDVPVDTVTLTVSKGKQYTIAVFDSAGSRKFRAFAH